MLKSLLTAIVWLTAFLACLVCGTESAFGATVTISSPVTNTVTGGITVNGTGTGSDATMDSVFSNIIIGNGGYLRTSSDITLTGTGAIEIADGSGTAGAHLWNKAISNTDARPASDAITSNFNMRGGTLTVGSAQYAGFLEVGEFRMTGGIVNIGGSNTGFANDGKWRSMNPFLNGGWRELTGDATTANAGVSLTGGILNLKDYGYIGTTLNSAGHELFHIDGATINMTGGVGKESILAAWNWATQTGDVVNTSDGDTTNDYYHTILRMDSGKVNVTGQGVILSRETYFTGGEIYVATSAKLSIADSAASAAPIVGGNATQGITHSAIARWGDFNINGGKITNAGVIDFATAGLTLNATSGSLESNLAIVATAGAASGTTYATNLHVTSGAFTVDGNLTLTAGSLTNAGILTITGTTSATPALTLGGTTNFGGAVTATSITIGDGATAAFKNGGAISNQVRIGKNSTLKFDGPATLTVKAIDFDPTSILKVDGSITQTTSGSLITVTGGIANMTVGGDTAALASYLAQFNTAGLTRDIDFGVSGNSITLTVTDNRTANAETIIGSVMADQGVGDMTEYAKPLADAWQDIAVAYTTNPENATVFTTETGQSTATLITKLAEGGFKLSGDVRGAEAATNFLTGMDMAKSIGVAVQTAHRAVGNIFKRIQHNNTLRTAMNDTYGSDSAYASSALNTNYANRIWLAGMGMWEQGDRHNGNAGYDYDAYGIQLGYDRVFGAMTFGGSLSYAEGDYADKAALASDSAVKNYAFNLYGTYNHASGFFASVVGGYTHSDYSMNSNYGPGWNKADYDADTWTIGTTLGYDIRPRANFTMTPSVGLYYYTSKSGTFTSTGLNGIQIKNHGTELPLALLLKYDIAVCNCSFVSLEANGGYTYNFSDEGGRATALGYNGITGGNGASTTLKSSRHGYNVGGGVTYNTPRWNAGLKYDYYLSKASDAHVLRAEVGFKF